MLQIPVDFDGAIRSQETVRKEEANFIDILTGRDHHRHDNVPTRIVVHLRQRNLSLCMCIHVRVSMLS